MYFETSHLIIRDYEERDFQEYFRLKHNPKTMYYLQDIQLKTEKEAEKEFRGILEDQKSPSRIFYFFHVELKGSHETIGRVMLLNRSNGLYNMLLRKTEFTGLQLDVWQKILGQRR